MNNLTKTLMAPALMALLANNSAMGGSTYKPHIDPGQFQEAVDNPYFPAAPGTILRYTTKIGNAVEEDEVTVTNDTKVIMGVTCIAIHDVTRVNGKIKEDAVDWFAQDKDGNVWYFGESTREWHGKQVSTEGSWIAGVGQSQPGIAMPAKIESGAPYWQEYSPGHAEDMAQIAAVDDSITVSAGSFAKCVRTKEWSLLESGSEKKWYAPGVGYIKSVSSDGEVTELVSVAKPQ